MTYVDDWYHTPLDDQKRFQEKCLRPYCGHMRYLHGDTKEVSNPRAITYTAGKCTRCKCTEFQDTKSITRDEVLDVAELLGDKGKQIRLGDFGIGPVTCGQVITRWTENESHDVPCYLAGGHAGAHEAREP